jgi:hypothetical protein
MATPKPADLNEDGKVTAKERAKYKKEGKEGADRLSEGELEKRYNFAKEVITKNPELYALWQKATDPSKGYMTADEFQNQLRNTQWYQNNAEHTRKAWTAEALGGEDWNAQVQEANLKVQEAATKMGANLTPEQQSEMARKYIYEGWGVSGRERLMAQGLSSFIGEAKNGFMEGGAGNFQQQLAETARNNGLRLNPAFYQQAAQSVAMGLTTEEDWMRDVRSQAASKWPTLSDKVMSGMDVSELASGYVNLMAQTFEIDPSSISLDDPYIRNALAGADPATGNPMTMGLWDFEKSLKNDPRWMGTKQATNDIAGIGMDVLRSFGMVG